MYNIDTYMYLPTVLEHPGQSRIYCSRPLSRTQEAIYLESPAKSGHQLPRYCTVAVRQVIFISAY